MKRSVVTIGTFDGVHAGHAALVRRARELADAADARVVVMCFDPHPLTVVAPAKAPARLTTFADRAALLGEAGANEVIRLEPSGPLLAQSPDEFVATIVRDLAPVAIVEGPDFRFGRGRAGDLSTLRALGRAAGFDVHEVAPVEVALSDHTLARASSTLARWLITHGRVRDAALVLGRAYTIPGIVEPGDRRGRTIGCPTANVATECLAPADGVYCGFGTIADGRRFPAAISVGTKPTYGDNRRCVEAYLIGAPVTANLPAIHGLPEYGWELRLSCDHWIRDQMTFASTAALVDQINRDLRVAHSLLSAPAAAAHHEALA
ncbi:MAG: bifunctional riboflavin kinase/FMN adenylyltransferase [Phycisphaerales bacterium]